MLCYLDRSFCNQPCANEECYRNYSKKHQEGAREWWGDDGAPVALMNFRTEGCGFIPKDGHDDDES